MSEIRSVSPPPKSDASDYKRLLQLIKGLQGNGYHINEGDIPTYMELHNNNVQTIIDFLETMYESG